MSNTHSISDAQLCELARSARERAYTPYSHFAVGAALCTVRGDAFVGCNIENLSFGLTLCAERVAVGTALANGATDFDRIAIISDSIEPVMPCGACRQVLAEFNPRLRILSATLTGHAVEHSLNELLPLPRQGILG